MLSFGNPGLHLIERRIEEEGKENRHKLRREERQNGTAACGWPALPAKPPWGEGGGEGGGGGRGGGGGGS
jgi:hypothetical protein